MRVKLMNVLRFSLTLAFFGGASFGITLLSVEPAEAQGGTCTHTSCYIDGGTEPGFECIAAPAKNCEVSGYLSCEEETCLIPE